MSFTPNSASRGPVVITKHRKPRFVLMSIDRFEELTGGGSSQRAYALDESCPRTPVAPLTRRWRKRLRYAWSWLIMRLTNTPNSMAKRHSGALLVNLLFLTLPIASAL